MSERLTKNSPITIVEPAPNAFGKLDNPIMADNYSGINLPTRAAELLKAILNGEGWIDVVAINPRFNECPGVLNESDLKRIFSSPILGISSITRTIPQSAELARRYKAANPDGIVIAGGPHVTFADEESLEWADYVVRFEGDITFPEMLEAIMDSGSAKGVLGISYKDGDRVVREPDRPLLTEEQLSQLPWPDFDSRFRNGKVNAVTVAAARGCPHRCEFCSVTSMNGLCQRRVDNSVVFPRIKALYLNETNDRIFPADDNFAGKPKQAEALLEQIIDEGLTDYRYMMQLHPSIGLRKGFPDLVRKAGVFLPAFGIESINDEALAAVGKSSLSLKVTNEGIRAFREAGVPVLGMFINGIGTDDEEGLREQSEWAKKMVDIAQFFVPGPLPGTPFAKKMAEEGRILTKKYFLYDGQHVIIRPEAISPFRLQTLVNEMNEEFFAYRLGGKNVRLADRKMETIIQLYGRNVLKNVREVFNSPQTQKHLQDLKAWS